MAENKVRKFIGVDWGNGKDATCIMKAEIDKNKDIVVTDVSFVTNCPFCGSDDWDNPKTMPNGIRCSHPTKFHRVDDLIIEEGKSDEV